MQYVKCEIPATLLTSGVYTITVGWQSYVDVDTLKPPTVHVVSHHPILGPSTADFELRAVLSTADASDRSTRLALHAMMTGNLSEAEQFVADALRTNPLNAEALATAGRVALKRQDCMAASRDLNNAADVLVASWMAKIEASFIGRNCGPTSLAIGEQQLQRGARERAAASALGPMHLVARPRHASHEAWRTLRTTSDNSEAAGGRRASKCMTSLRELRVGREAAFVVSREAAFVVSRAAARGMRPAAVGTVRTRASRQTASPAAPSR